MNLTPLNLTVLALAAVSGAHAADSDSKPFVLRGSTGKWSDASRDQPGAPDDPQDMPLAIVEPDRQNYVERESDIDGTFEQIFVELGFSCKKHKKRGEMKCGSCETQEARDSSRYQRFCDECCGNGGSDDNGDTRWVICDNGRKRGETVMRDEWEWEGDDCANAWNLSNMARSVKKKYLNIGGDERVREYNRCARNAIDEEVEKIKEECFEDNPGQCFGLGQAAATMIALYDVCDEDSAMDRGNINDYERSCRDMAYTICEGQVASSIKKYCPNKMPRSSRLLELMEECPAKVDSLLGRDVEVKCFRKMPLCPGNENNEYCAIADCGADLCDCEVGKAFCKTGKNPCKERVEVKCFHNNPVCPGKEDEDYCDSVDCGADLCDCEVGKAFCKTGKNPCEGGDNGNGGGSEAVAYK